MMRKLCLFILSAAAILSISSCADTQSNTANNTGVSAIPWDRPEKWETGSQVPGAEFMNSQ